MAADQPGIGMLVAFNKAWNDHDVDALMSFMSDDCEFYAVGGAEVLGAVHRGRDAVRKAYESAWLNIPDAQWVDGVHYVFGDHGVSESTFTGTTKEGERIEARMVDVFTFRNGKIAIKNAFRKNRPPQPAK